MSHPFLHLMATRPQLLLDHAQAYAELLAAEASCLGAAWRDKAVLTAMALCCLAVAAILAGVALMLWAVAKDLPPQAPWALAASPLVPALGGLWCLVKANKRDLENPFKYAREQINADLSLLRKAGS